MKPHIGSEANISREEWNGVKYIWNNSYIWTAVVDQSEEFVQKNYHDKNKWKGDWIRQQRINNVEVLSKQLNSFQVLH